MEGAREPLGIGIGIGGSKRVVMAGNERSASSEQALVAARVGTARCHA